MVDRWLHDSYEYLRTILLFCWVAVAEWRESLHFHGTWMDGGSRDMDGWRFWGSKEGRESAF